MSQNPQEPSSDLHALSLSKTFSRLGWIGFWLQAVFGSLPVIALIYYFAFTGSGTAARSGFPFIEYLAIINILTTLFLVFWFYHYTRLAKRALDPERRLSQAAMTRSVWTGVIASTLGVFLSTVLILLEAANLLFYFLKAPQAGMPVIQTSGIEAVRWVSTIDMVSLVALILTQLAEVIALMLNLRLLSRTTRSSLLSAQAAKIGTSNAVGGCSLDPLGPTAKNPESASHSPMESAT